MILLEIKSTKHSRFFPTNINIQQKYSRRIQKDERYRQDKTGEMR